MTYALHLGDCLDVMRGLDAESVQTCVTSPPYYGLRDYGHEGQIGLEETPDAYVARLVDVFREVRRVLREDGTLWLNLGDSYSGSANAGGETSRTCHSAPNAQDRNLPTKRGPGIKPKDLLGIPWRVAFALQQPYYAGRVKRVEDRIWLAAMLDGEGCFYIHRRPAGQHAGGGYHRTQDTYSAAFEVANTHKAIIDRCAQIAGVGSVICQEKDRRQPLWRWTVRSAEARDLAREIYPHLVAKQHQCRIVCGTPPSGQRAEAAWHALKLLHAGSATDVDFAEPETCFQPGYYLRQDVIWSKPNPMPESVRDRCTKAHEYVFLLAKSARYFYDADAIAEPSIYVGDVKTNNAGKNGDMGAFGATRTGFMRPEGVTVKDTRNRRSVWTIPSKPYSGAHFAVMPEALVEPCILAGSRRGDIVLDPFTGSGTVGAVAVRAGRSFVGSELNPAYLDLAHARIREALATEPETIVTPEGSMTQLALFPSNTPGAERSARDE